MDTVVMNLFFCPSHSEGGREWSDFPLVRKGDVLTTNDFMHKWGSFR